MCDSCDNDKLEDLRYAALVEEYIQEMRARRERLQRNDIDFNTYKYLVETDINAAVIGNPRIIRKSVASNSTLFRFI